MEVNGHFMQMLLLSLMMVSASHAWYSRRTCQDQRLPLGGDCSRYREYCPPGAVCERLGPSHKCKIEMGGTCDPDDDQCVATAVCDEYVCKTALAFDAVCPVPDAVCGEGLTCEDKCKYNMGVGGCTENEQCVDGAFCHQETYDQEVDGEGCKDGSVSGNKCVKNTCRDESKCEWQCGAGYDKNKTCQCNGLCQKFGNCCDDYLDKCEDEFKCEERCGAEYDKNKPCQCNSRCQDFGNCCDDYQDKCELVDKCSARAVVTELLWSLDGNRLSAEEYTVNWQAEVAKGNTDDRSSESLFSLVNDTDVLARPTFAGFVYLLDNYNIFHGTAESLNTPKNADIDYFYSVIRSTDIFNTLYDYLSCRGHVANESDFQSKFYDMWFNPYDSSSKPPDVLDTSGFERVMVGTVKVANDGTESSEGFNNWIQFYMEEKVGRLDYNGFLARMEDAPYVIYANYAWTPALVNQAVVPSSSFFLGSSPEFDMALYTLCAFEAPNYGGCRVRLAGVNVRVQIWDNTNTDGLQIVVAYPDLEE